MKVFKKHATQNRYWSFDLKEYVTQNMIPVGSLVIDHSGRDISRELKVWLKLNQNQDYKN